MTVTVSVSCSVSVVTTASLCVTVSGLPTSVSGSVSRGQFHWTLGVCFIAGEGFNPTGETVKKCVYR